MIVRTYDWDVDDCLMDDCLLSLIKHENMLVVAASPMSWGNCQRENCHIHCMWALFSSMRRSIAAIECCLDRQSSRLTVILSDSCPVWQLSCLTVVLSDICAICPTRYGRSANKITLADNCQAWQFLVDNCQSWQFFHSSDSFSRALTVLSDSCPSGSDSCSPYSCLVWQLSGLTDVRADRCPSWQLSELTVVRADR